MPSVWLPENGTEFLHYFISHVKSNWLAYCDAHLADVNLRRQVINSNGSDPQLLNTLLEDGLKWLNYRQQLGRFTSKIRDFIKSYSRKYNETGDLDEVLDQFYNDIGKKLDLLDENSRDIIQLVSVSYYIVRSIPLG
ncbi:uncharacterized protein ColSpa_06649 [Colletotrichum spaethianum]|uniref:Uncharacterized protein n=1 Tax=Colletotrichum spaethianum TaxID=700344 RepID=A0AA37LDM5_9PEZI|nr:uncharacterized protein ColSpa_06649 [Colletotrichum spaethianum]GKT46468.1 hypothetical protein ColSpa_06649 [Colletotrichum spaethianum]